MKSACIEWPFGKNGKKYGQVWLGGKRRAVHRLVYELYHGKLPQVVRHTCDNPKCFNIEHLVGGTHADNARDKVDRDRQWRPIGENNPKAKLTKRDVQSIRVRLSTGELQKFIARDYGVSITSISYIKLGKSWALDGSVDRLAKNK